MRASRVVLCGFLICGIFVFLASQRIRATPLDSRSQSPRSAIDSSPLESAPSSYGARWVIGGSYSTTLELNNDGTQATSARVVLFSQDGQEVAAADTQVRPGVSARLSFASLFPDVNKVACGGFSVSYTQSAPLTSGRVFITDPSGGSVSYPIEGGNRYDSGNRLWAPWWLPDPSSDGSLTLFNSSVQSISVLPSIQVNGVEVPWHTIAIAAKASATLSLRSLLERGGAEGASAGSVTLQYTGRAHALQPLLLLSNPQTGFALIPDFNAGHQEQIQQTMSWHFPYLPLEITNASGINLEESLDAKLLLSNGTTAEMEPNITAYAVSKGKLQQIALPVPVLAPRETRLLDLSQLLQQLPPRISRIALTISHTGQAGDLGISVFSVNPSNQVVARSEGFILPVNSSTISYWDLSSSTLLLHWIKSVNGVSASANATLYYQTQSGLKSYTLPALTAMGQEPKAINLKEMINAGVRDVNGAMLPHGVNSALVVLTPLEPAPGPVSIVNLATCLTDCKDEERSKVLRTDTTSAIAFATLPTRPTPSCGTEPAYPCLAYLYYRGVPFLGLPTGAHHDFWFIEDADGNPWVIDGGPSLETCSPVTSCGYLDDWITPGTVSKEYSEDNIATATLWYNSGYTDANCIPVAQLFVAAETWGQSISYSITGPNSNTFAYDMAVAAGFSVPTPPTSPGW
jgi:hypothetical protein